jgi:hypothetical protein
VFSAFLWDSCPFGGDIYDFCHVFLVFLHGKPSDSFLAYFKNPNDTVPQDVFTLDDDFSMFLAPRGVKLRIANRSREMLLEFDSNRELQDWVQTIRVFLPASSAGSVGGFRRRPFGSFAPQRLGCTACWLVEGATVFAAMTKAMLAAKTTIFIAGEWSRVWGGFVGLAMTWTACGGIGQAGGRRLMSDYCDLWTDVPK